jgi:hypothetical protein
VALGWFDIQWDGCQGWSLRDLPLRDARNGGLGENGRRLKDGITLGW